MTTATGPEDPAAIPDPLTEREQIIRQIHRFADWLTAHPEAPAPYSISAANHVGAADEVGAWADESGAVRKASNGLAWAELLVSGDTFLPVIRLSWFVTTGLPDVDVDSPTRRWVGGGNA